MSPTQPPGPRRRAAVPPARRRTSQVRPGWLLGALGLLVLAALCCAYLSLCLLFLQGQWQLLYHAGTALHTTTHPLVAPGDGHLAFDEVRFGPSEAGTSELSGWWIPAPPASPLAPTTVLYLHDGAGSLGDPGASSSNDLEYLHALGCTLFAIDYRGYGLSAGEHPNEPRMIEDATRALRYMTDTRHLATGSIVIWGRGIGATIAAEAAQPQPQDLRLVLDQINPPAFDLLKADPRTRWLPVRLLQHDTLDAAAAVRGSSKRKLFLTRVQDQLASGDHPLGVGHPDAATMRIFNVSGQPEIIATLEDEVAVRAFLNPEALGTNR